MRQSAQNGQIAACRGPRAAAIPLVGGAAHPQDPALLPSITGVAVLSMAVPASTPVPISEAKTHRSDLAKRVRLQHERITLTRNGEPEAVLLSVDDLEGLEMTSEILADSAAAARISESLAALDRGEQGVDLATLRADLARRRRLGT